MKKEHRELITIFLLALGVRLLLFIAVGPWNEEVARDRVLIADGKMYYNLAVNLLKYNVFSNPIGPPFVPNIFRTPIYPFFLASLYAIFGYKLYIPILGQQKY